MKPRQVLGKYFEVYGQLSPITPEAGKKRAPFWLSISHKLPRLGYCGCHLHNILGQTITSRQPNIVAFT